MTIFLSYFWRTTSCIFSSLLLIASAHAGKPNAGLAVSSATHYQLEVGEVQAITLSLSSLHKHGLLHLMVMPSDEQLELLSANRYQFDLSADAALSVTLNLLPHSAGRFYLMLNAQLDRQNAPDQAQALGVVVQVGEAPARLQLQKHSTSPRVISLPARETR